MIKLQSIDIENFRCFRSFHLDLDDTTVLIGENNSGKTALLDAIRLCLGDSGQRKSPSFDAYDFHLPNDTAAPTRMPAIKIRLRFAEDQPDEWDRPTISALRGVVQPRNDGTNQVTYEVICQYDATSGDYVLESGFLDLAGNRLPENKAAVANLKRLVQFYYLDALRDAAYHFDPRGRYWKPFIQDSKLTDADRTEIERRIQEVNDLVVSKHGSFADVSQRLGRVQQVVPLSGGDVVSIEAVPGRIFDMLAKAQVNLGAPTGAHIPLGRHGEGTKSLSVLMLFNAFLEAQGGGEALIALEEPEAHLHPSAIRALWKLLEAIPGQKIISTHSGDILAEAPIDKVRRMRRLAGGVSAHRLQAATLTESERRKLDFHIRYQRGELLFARCWILVEGETEITLLPELARHLGHDFERIGVRCVPYQQAGGLGTYLKVANDLGIRWCILADNDRQGAPDFAKAQAAIGTADPTKVLHQMPQKDIERYLTSCGITVPIGLAKPDAALHVLGLIQGGQAVPPLLEQVIEHAVELAKEG